jgi:hypothetical protein
VLLVAFFSCLSDLGLADVPAIRAGFVPGLARRETRAVAGMHKYSDHKKPESGFWS